MIWQIVALAAAAQAAPPEDELIVLERESWVAWKAQDAAFWTGFLSDDHVEMGYAGPATKAQVVAMIRAHACTVASYQLSQFSVRYFSADDALVTYRAEQDTMCGKLKVPSPVWASSHFIRRGGRWENVFYAHIPATS